MGLCRCNLRGVRHTLNDDLISIIHEETQRRYLSFDLLTGKVTPQHPLFTWLIRNGATSNELRAIAQRAVTIDIMGLNFYPEWSAKQIGFDQKGRLAYRIQQKDGAGFEQMLRSYYERYQVPIMITETSAQGSKIARSNWLKNSLATIKTLREDGLPIVGYTWFPLFTMINWKYRFGRSPLNHYYQELGLYQLNQTATGERWSRTVLINEFVNHVKNPSTSIGTIIPK